MFPFRIHQLFDSFLKEKKLEKQNKINDLMRLPFLCEKLQTYNTDQNNNIVVFTWERNDGL